MTMRFEEIQIGRRAILQGSVLLLGAASLPLSQPTDLWADKSKTSVRFGLVTDLHFADKPTGGSRHYRESVDKLTEAAAAFEEASLDFVVELGDLIDAAASIELELTYLKTINNIFGSIKADKHYVLGNHCVTTLNKQEFLGAVERSDSYYSFDTGETHFVVLDACFRKDGEPYGHKNFNWTDTAIPATELEWLKGDLASTKKKTVVLAHQRLDVTNQHGVKNSPDVRKILEEAGNVAAVFQGHSHANEYRDINGIHYCTMVAMVEGSGKENSGYSILEVAASGAIKIDGFRKQKDYSWKPRSASLPVDS
ncbi:MAG: putative phosphodiesterase [Pirellulaceae bacterium]|jgi:predicted phosphodiesterase